MTAFRRVSCAQCGEMTAMSAEHLAEIRAKVPTFPPVFVPNICVRCTINDPAMKTEMDRWLDAEMGRLTSRVRNALARPLEAIDRFVESFK